MGVALPLPEGQVALGFAVSKGKYLRIRPHIHDTTLKTGVGKVVCAGGGEDKKPSGLWPEDRTLSSIYARLPIGPPLEEAK